MPEPTDALMPILQRIQSDIADLRREVQVVGADVKTVTERMDAFEDYFTYTMGLTQQNKADIGRLGSQFRALKEQVNGL